MKLSDILQQKAMIDSWDADKELSALNDKITLIKKDIEDIQLTDLTSNLDSVNESINYLVHDMNALQSNIEFLKSQASELMQAMVPAPLAESYERYDERKDWFNEEYAETLRGLDQFANNEEACHKFHTLVAKFASWKYPTLYIRPNSTHFLDALKASDILYVMDQCDITKWLKQNTEPNFFKAIRFKLIDEDKETFIQHVYPPHQMGFILMEHFLHFKPLEVIKQYLSECMSLLRPGGHLLFTYNNCDLPSGARNFEKDLYCYTPGKMLRLICEAMGYEVIDDTMTDRVSWLCLKKPGEIETLKGGKCLGQIMDEE